MTGCFSDVDFVRTECKVEYKDGKRETVSLSEMRCMLADGLVWAKNPGSGRVSAAEWLPGQRYRHNTLCRHELGRRVAGFACVRLFPSGQIIWVPNKPQTLLPFEENLERLGKPTAVRTRQAASCFVSTPDHVHPFLQQEVMRGIQEARRAQGVLAFYRARATASKESRR